MKFNIFNFYLGKIWFVLRKVLKWKPYKPHTVTVLTEAQRQRRFASAAWFLSKDLTFFSNQVLWLDEKYFVLNNALTKRTMLGGLL